MRERRALLQVGNMRRQCHRAPVLGVTGTAAGLCEVPGSVIIIIIIYIYIYIYIFVFIIVVIVCSWGLMGTPVCSRPWTMAASTEKEKMKGE